MDQTNQAEQYDQTNQVEQTNQTNQAEQYDTKVKKTKIQTLNNNSEWLKYLVSNDLMSKEFVISLE